MVRFFILYLVQVNNAHYIPSHTDNHIANFIWTTSIPAEVILPPVTTALSQAEIDQKIDQALSHPLGGVMLKSFQGAKSVAIAVNDKTAPVPYQVMLPPLFDSLETDWN